MKLIKRVERAEGVAAERAAPAPGRMGICWSADDTPGVLLPKLAQIRPAHAS